MKLQIERDIDISFVLKTGLNIALPQFSQGVEGISHTFIFQFAIGRTERQVEQDAKGTLSFAPRRDKMGWDLTCWKDPRGRHQVETEVDQYKKNWMYMVVAILPWEIRKHLLRIVGGLQGRGSHPEELSHWLSVQEAEGECGTGD